MRDKIDQLLDTLEAQADNFSSFETDELSNFTPAQAAKIRSIRSKTPARHIGRDNVSVDNLKGNPSFNAQLDVKVNLKNGSAVAVVGEGWEYALFGANDYESAYNTIITDATTLGSGMNVKGGVLQTGGAKAATALVINTAAGAGVTGVITITSDVVDYPVLLKALMTDMFHVNRIRISVSDTTAAGLKSVSDKLRIIKKSVFGKRDEDVISMSAYKVPEQMQAGIIDIPVNVWIDSNTSIVSKIYATVTTIAAESQNVTYSFFIDKYYKHDPKTLGL